MNAVSALLLAVLVHLGGVELDTTRDASLQLFRSSELTGQWELEVSRSGVYRFVSDEGLVIVEGLREASLTYAVLHYETVSDSGETTAPVPRRLQSLGTMNLQPQAQNLRAPQSSRGEVTLQIADLPVAWSGASTSADTEAEPSPDDTSSSPSDSSPESGPDGTISGTISVTIIPGQWSARHTESDQVMVLQVR